ncbi:receptor-type tyrosine-protein phosphatase epsilon-like [Styela clava]
MGKRYENKVFNLSDDVIPYDHNAVVLVMCNNETSVPYVNASWVETYDENTSMIAAQTPMNEGISFFWRSVLDNRVNTIVMLARAEECIQYWPQRFCEPLRIDNVSVTLLGENINGSISHRFFKVLRETRRLVLHKYNILTGVMNNVQKMVALYWILLGRCREIQEVFGDQLVLFTAPMVLDELEHFAQSQI